MKVFTILFAFVINRNRNQGEQFLFIFYSCLFFSVGFINDTLSLYVSISASRPHGGNYPNVIYYTMFTTFHRGFFLSSIFIYRWSSPVLTINICPVVVSSLRKKKIEIMISYAHYYVRS